MNVGDRVQNLGEPWFSEPRVMQLHGYKWPGVVVSIFETLAGKTRVVVECTVPEVAGALHIYAPEQLGLDA